MKFWLVFIQKLPTIHLDAVDSFNYNESDHNLVEYLPKIKTNLIANIKPNLPINTSPTLAQLNLGTLTFFGSLIGALVLLGLISVWAYTRVYTVTPNNEAFVRSGGILNKEKKVILNGGCMVIPGIHELTRVPLREISIDVVRQGNLAVRTRDYLRANMRVTFYVCISADKDAVLTATQRLSKQGKISDVDIKDALEKRADDAIRAAAKEKSIAEIDSDKLGFAQAVLNLIQHDLRKVGLTLNSIAISEIEESDTYDENSFFDAQGVRLRTETIQKSIKQKLDVELETQREKREIELNTKIAIEEQELNAEKQSLTLAKQKEEAKLAQVKEIEFLKAQRQREIQESRDQEQAKVERNKILQEQAVQEEQIKQKLAVQQSQIEANIALEERNKQFKIAQATQQEEAEVAEINRQRAVEASRLLAQIEIAEADQKSKIAQQQAAITIANKEKERFTAEAERAKAEEAVLTAKKVENAEREQKLQVIAAEREAQEKRISEQNVVEIDVFRRRRQAEIARQAAELEAEAIRTLADANQYKSLAEAQGKLALIQAENTLNNANRTADIIKEVFPLIIPQLPQIIESLSPQPGVLGDARIYAFPGMNGNNGNGNSANDVSKLLFSTSGLSLVNTLLDEGKLSTLIAQIKGLLTSDQNSNNGEIKTINPPQNQQPPTNTTTIKSTSTPTNPKTNQSPSREKTSTTQLPSNPSQSRQTQQSNPDIDLSAWMDNDEPQVK